MDEQRAEFEAWAKQAGWPHHATMPINKGPDYFSDVSLAVWQTATQLQQERIEELEALVEYLQQEVARVERNRDMWRSQCQHQASALASIRQERDAAIQKATKEQE